MFFPLRVNSALAMLGIDPRVVRAEYRQGAQAIGKANGNSPQEVALFIASQLPLAYQFGLQPITAKDWIRKRKINPRDPEIRDALIRLGWGVLADF